MVSAGAFDDLNIEVGRAVWGWHVRSCEDLRLGCDRRCNGAWWGAYSGGYNTTGYGWCVAGRGAFVRLGVCGFGEEIGDGGCCNGR